MTGVQTESKVLSLSFSPFTSILLEFVETQTLDETTRTIFFENPCLLEIVQSMCKKELEFLQFFIQIENVIVGISLIFSPFFFEMFSELWVMWKLEGKSKSITIWMREDDVLYLTEIFLTENELPRRLEAVLTAWIVSSKSVFHSDAWFWTLDCFNLTTSVFYTMISLVVVH